MSRLNIDKLLVALENEKNESIMETTKSDIKTIKNNVLQELNLSRETLKEWHLKLQNYRFISDISELQSGCYLRWVNLKNYDNLQLTRGSFLCDIDITDGGINIIFKTPYGRHCTYKMNELLLFQRITDDEQVILSALKYLHK
jgi:hypothetical protein